MKEKKKLIWSIVLFAISLVPLGFAIYCFCYVGDYTGKEQENLVGNAIFFLVATLILMGISCYLNYLYRSENENPGVLSLVMFIVTVIPTGIVLVALFIAVKILKGLKQVVDSAPSSGTSSQSKEADTWTVNKNGFERTLEKTGSTSYIDGKYYENYRDDLGNIWYSNDEKHFIEK